jgi:hypothetical protein
MENWEIKEVFDNRYDAVEFYKLLYDQISKFKSLSFELTLKYGEQYSVEGFIKVVDPAYKDAINSILEKLDA